ncbi:root hair defective 3 GTP-binding protein [Cylindrobasidium torrendii FP15055 ss-10]|uniref:Root hair defective 3 GTP-binding protein n=1 Tax=Cylindrobasidium torrendii FP15055 ss-10 TaxID=1314674 RepID=A0A0D7BAA6_9AGAR|nr:root hair defective 3 GTP-binding protein [Cylindrobasidium torrendii FP15055 ss-10]
MTAAVNGHKPEGSTDRLQIINDAKEFTQDLSPQLEQWGLRDAGFNYDIVAVFGSQSTGKSTLLNRLFGTTFDVMDETQRQQTTKGIWMCRGKEMNVMVMDVEGTDGRERGEDQDFERKSALFSLASSEIMIINLWEHQVGLYQGANMGLLKTVFEVNLGLFGKKSQDSTSGRTCLLFVIRDHIGVTPLANLQNTLTQDILKIWDSLSKPAELADCKLSDYFDLSFTTLPHKILAADQFEAEVRKLRVRFTDKGSEGYLFKPAYHKRIPADGIPFYMENIWEQVQTNKDLDLPTQQELLAQFRCDEISSVALAEFTEQSKSQKRPIEAGKVVDGLGKLMRGWRIDALTRYDRDASRYHQGVYKRKRTDLIATLDATLSPLFLGQLKNSHRLCLNSFKKELLDSLKGDDYSFADVVRKAQTSWETTFLETAKEAVVEENDSQWVWEDEAQLLKEEMTHVADQCRKDETKKMVNLIERNFKKQITEPIELAMSTPSPDMWDRILKSFKSTLSKAESTYLIKARSFNCTEEENTVALATLRRRTWVAFREKIDEQTADSVILGKLRAYFEERFRYDEQGVPRVWKPEDDIDGAFMAARDQTLTLIGIYGSISPDDPNLAYDLPEDAAAADPLAGLEEYDFDASLSVFSETKALDVTNKFRKEADAYYVEAKRSTVTSIAQIPVWMYGMLVVLGWNEAMAILFNPLYFMALLFSVTAAYLIFQLGLAGPLLQIGKTLSSEVQRQATSRLREHFSEPAVLAQPVRSGRSVHDDEREKRAEPK